MIGISSLRVCISILRHQGGQWIIYRRHGHARIDTLSLDPTSRGDAPWKSGNMVGLESSLSLEILVLEQQ